ncbi:MAG: molybdopterin-dependent oxidoreductase [Planctomycetota bacterium]
MERQVHPERLLHPERRTKAGWERLGRNAALDLAAERLGRARDEHGPLFVLALSYSGLHTGVARVLWRRFWAHFGGATLTRGGLSVEAVAAAQEMDFGGDATHDPEDLVNARAIVAWGKNPLVTRPHWAPFLKEARRRGAILAVVDPVRTATARFADRWHRIRPGTDGVLALAVARRLIEREAIDRAFVAEHTRGFAAFRRLAFARTIGEAARATDLAAAEIEALAELYATRRPFATAAGLGPAYYASGAAQVRCIDALAALTGNLGVPGGGAHTDLLRNFGLDRSVLADLPAGAERTRLLPRLGAQMRAAASPPIRVAYVAGANPAATAPRTDEVLAALRALDFVVAVDQFPTATSAAAHLRLPCTTYLEMDDLVTAYGHNWLGVTQRGATPRRMPDRRRDPAGARRAARLRRCPARHAGRVDGAPARAARRCRREPAPRGPSHRCRRGSRHARDVRLGVRGRAGAVTIAQRGG